MESMGCSRGLGFTAHPKGSRQRHWVGNASSMIPWNPGNWDPCDHLQKAGNSWIPWDGPGFRISVTIPEGSHKGSGHPGILQDSLITPEGSGQRHWVGNVESRGCSRDLGPTNHPEGSHESPGHPGTLQDSGPHHPNRALLTLGALPTQPIFNKTREKRGSGSRDSPERGRDSSGQVGDSPGQGRDKSGQVGDSSGQYRGLRSGSAGAAGAASGGRGTHELELLLPLGVGEGQLAPVEAFDEMSLPLVLAAAGGAAGPAPAGEGHVPALVASVLEGRVVVLQHDLGEDAVLALPVGLREERGGFRARRGWGGVWEGLE